MISYAQNAEDVVLARAFADDAEGFYIDVGAGHPSLESVTKHFYDAGWTGVNIEPLPMFAELLREERPHDINLQIGLADQVDEMLLYEGSTDSRGGSTFRKDLAAHDETGPTHRVHVETLANVCSEHVGSRIVDFLKVDVEGLEERVLRGADWSRWRPRVVVVEATLPNSHLQTHGQWEPLLLDAGYEFALFDGLNRFYRVEEESALGAALASPASVLDDYVPLRVHVLQGIVKGHQAEVQALREQLLRCDQQVRTIEVPENEEG